MSTQQTIHGDCLEQLRLMPDKSVDCIIDDAPYGENMHGLGEIPSQEILTESLRVSRECLITFTSSHIEATAEYMKYSPKPDRRLTWASDFKLGGVQSSQMIWRMHDIYCWRLPKKQYVKCISFDILTDNCELGNWWTHHGTKPLSLMKKLLAAFCPPKGSVLDRFCGSGTTLVAAYQLEMNAIGIDRDLKSIEITKKRLELEQSQLNLLAKL